ncbi:MAG: riboflavin synthase [Gammaproteobacteria bacterium]|nr:riboflavin synthase [Gammaproteobacteria bacterium]
MFTGIVTQIGALASRERHNGDEALAFAVSSDWLYGSVVGDSIAVNGVCLTVIQNNGNKFAVDVSGETLSRTTLGGLDIGATVNLERALSLGDALGGHLVSGHVDAVAEILDRQADSQSVRIWVSLPQELAPLVAEKGSICVDGISLTVNEVEPDRFGVNIIPHTLEATVAGTYQPGTPVNLEVDIVARYVARILSAGNGAATE